MVEEIAHDWRGANLCRVGRALAHALRDTVGVQERREAAGRAASEHKFGGGSEAGVGERLPGGVHRSVSKGWVGWGGCT